MLRSLIHFWRVHLAVAASAAVATGVLAGALAVGDSVRGSLRALTLERLGRIDWALVGERLFREALAADLAASPRWAGRFAPPAPALVLEGAAVHAGSRARASRVAVHGVDERFLGLFAAAPEPRLERAPGQLFPSVLLNAALARELGAAPGDELLLRFARPSDVPRESLIGERDPEAVVASLRVTVTRVLAGDGPARFALAPHQHEPLDAFVALDALGRALRAPGRVNALFTTALEPSGDPNPLLAPALTLDDLGLVARRADDHLTLESRELVLRPDLERAIVEAAATIGAAAQPVQTYLANRLRAGSRVLPYSLVTAVDPRDDPPWAALEWIAGDPRPGDAEDGIVLGAWAAADLDVVPGASIDLAYFEVGPREELIERETRLRVDGVVALAGLAADATLAPDYPGVSDARDMAAWDPPFPVDLGLVRPRDEEYWDRFGALPKAFVSRATGRRLWSTRFGSATAVRVGAAPGATLEETATRLGGALVERLGPAGAGLAFRPVKAEGLRAAAGATDFAGLFLGFSLFLIVSAGLLVGLLFGLGVEQRAREVGLLLAVGFPAARVRRRLLAEGAVVAAAGCTAGLALAVGYAALMVAGLRTLWISAVGSSRLALHVEPGSLALGFAIALVVVLAAVRLRLRALGRSPATSLLAGSFRSPEAAASGRRAGLLAVLAAAAALITLAAALATRRTEDPVLAFTAGALLLAAGLAAFAAWCRRGRRRDRLPGRSTLVAMAARSGAASPARSVLSVALVATACFVIVTVAANRSEPSEDPRERRSGSGGFALVAESQVPLHQDLERQADLGELGFSAADAAVLEGTTVVPLRLLPGDDASCLNLYRPERPRLLGVPPRLVERGGFGFRRTAALPAGADNPWELLSLPLEGGAIPAFADANSATWILKVGLGDELALADEAGRPVRLRLVGLLDTSLFQSELLVTEQDLLRHFPGRSGYRWFLIDPPAGRESAVAGLLEERLEPFGFDVTPSRERLAGFRVVEHTYLATFQLLGGLGLLLGTLGLGVVMLRNVVERRGELAALRAFGFRRSRIARLVLLETAFLVVVGVGLGAGAALVASAPRLAATDVPWPSLAALLAAVVAAGLVSSLAAVRGALGTPLLPVLKEER